MENIEDHSNNNNGELDGEQRRDVGTTSTSSSSIYRLFGRQKPMHQIMGGGQAADVILWKKWHVSCGVIVVATVAWLLFERSGLPFLSVCSDVLLILIVLLFLRANYAELTNRFLGSHRQLDELPELELSEDMITSAAASFRAKVNYFLSIAHDITLGKDFRLFFKVVIALWLFSVIGSLVSFVTLAYVGTIIFVTIPALYSRYEEQIDTVAGFLHKRFSRQYRVVDDENIVRRLPRTISKDKDQ